MLNYIQKVTVESYINMTILADHETDIIALKLKGVDILDGHLAVSEAKEKGSVRRSQSPLTNGRSRRKYEVNEDVEMHQHNILKSLSQWGP